MRAIQIVAEWFSRLSDRLTRRVEQFIPTPEELERSLRHRLRIYTVRWSIWDLDWLDMDRDEPDLLWVRTMRHIPDRYGLCTRGGG